MKLRSFVKRSNSRPDIPAAILVLLVSLGSAVLAQEKPPEVGLTEATVTSTEVRPATGDDEGPARGRSTWPADPSFFLPMPLPLSEDGDDDTRTLPESNRAISFDLASREEKLGPSEAEILAAPRAPMPGGSAGEGVWNWPAVHGDDETATKNFSSLALISQPEDYPWRVAVKLFMSFRDTGGTLRGYVCSGSLIDSMHVITAGHCVYAHNDADNGWTFNDWAESITVVPAYENGLRPYGDARGVQFHSWTGWTGSADFDSDIGIIDLDRPIGARTGWHGYGWYGSCGSFTGNTWRHAGYPAAAPYTGQLMYTNSGSYDSCETILGIWYGDEVRFNRQSFGGQSGSGSYRPHNDCPSCWVRAVLSNGTGSYTDDVRITEGKYGHIGDFIDDDTPSSLDLIPMDVNTSSAVVVGEQLTSMNYLVHNYSSVSWSGIVNVEVYLSVNDNISTFDTLIQSHIFTWTFAPKSSVRINVTSPPTIPTTATPGTSYIGVILDLSDASTANNDSDGQDAAAIQIQGAPDLIVSSFSVDNSVPYTLEGITLDAIVENQGNGSSSGTFLRYLLSTNSIISLFDTQIGTDFVAGLGTGAASPEAMAMPAPTVAGIYWLGACVDAVTHESQAGNNCSTGYLINVLESRIFDNGFESGNVSAWSHSVP